MNWTAGFQARGSALCVGLDPDPTRLPADMGALDFCRAVVEVTADVAACFKPNAGFFEQFGPDGVRDFATVIAEIRREGIPVIADIKRGDIGSTAEAYASAYLGGPFDTDAVTVNPSLGLGTLDPWRRRARELDRGVFLLLRTSNEDAAVFQAPAEAAMIEALRDEPAFGAVVGATHPQAMAELRKALPETLFLVPGFGAQGGGGADLAACFTGGAGAVVNSSRAILYAGEGQDDWKDAVRAAARAAHDEIEKARKR